MGRYQLSQSSLNIGEMVYCLHDGHKSTRTTFRFETRCPNSTVKPQLTHVETLQNEYHPIELKEKHKLALYSGESWKFYGIQLECDVLL